MRNSDDNKPRIIIILATRKENKDIITYNTCVANKHDGAEKEEDIFSC